MVFTDKCRRRSMAAWKLLLERRSKRCEAAMMLEAGLGQRLAEAAQTRI